VRAQGAEVDEQTLLDRGPGIIGHSGSSQS
jgi:hypothetical protein